MIISAKTQNTVNTLLMRISTSAKELLTNAPTHLFSHWGLTQGAMLAQPVQNIWVRACESACVQVRACVRACTFMGNKGGYTKNRIFRVCCIAQKTDTSCKVYVSRYQNHQRSLPNSLPGTHTRPAKFWPIYSWARQHPDNCTRSDLTRTK